MTRVCARARAGGRGGGRVGADKLQATPPYLSLGNNSIILSSAKASAKALFKSSCA